MSHHSGNHGGQYRSPLTKRDKIIFAAILIVCGALIFGPTILAVRWWVFGS